MNIMAGEFFSASSKAFLRLDSDSPANLLIISGPLMRKKKAPVSLATARAIRVLPVPKTNSNQLCSYAKQFDRIQQSASTTSNRNHKYIKNNHTKSKFLNH